MSSAALQSAPHQASTITSLSPAPSPSNRQYTNQSSSQTRDPYYNQQISNASPSTTTRRPSRKPSGNGATSNAPQQPAYYSPSGNAPTSAPVTSRSANPSSQQPPSSIEETSPSGYPAAEPEEYHRRRGVPPVAPPRTSSNQRTSNAAAAATTVADRSRRGGQSSRMATGGDGLEEPVDNGSRQVNGNERERARDDPAATAASAASRSRRRAQQAPMEAIPPKSNTTRDARAAQSPPMVQSRSQAVAGSSTASPNGLSREPSEVINRIVVSKPEVDLDRERERMAESQPSSTAAESKPGLGVVGSEGVEDSGRAGSRSRHDHSTTKREKNTRFGEYFLGNTLGEGEFGKVKMGWKQEGGVQVAIKLIRRDSVGTNPTRLAKIYREIAILREISHPNIVRLHEMVETEKHIGIILEYASGGELFDYILNHRYLKDNAARRLFAQLVSGVGYLHKKGIVHRDLKLENLLLDRNRNIIITDFGFANTFNPKDELGEEIEYGLSSRDYVKRMELDKVLPDGFRRGDLMQTSCGSPCYAAPELVVSDSLYTGRKVDVWSCGVILYAMLAGYLPFDDDPANPEGDNINLLYKYIVSTPLTFPEYVTPHARDLLRRILVPDPRKRADLFEVARHSWLSEYAHVVEFITSSTTTTGDIANTTVGSEDHADVPLLARSASVREPTKTPKSPTVAMGDLARKHGTVDQDAEDSYPRPQKDNKRRTVQVEYVAPRSQTVRGEDTSAATNVGPSGSRTRARSESQGPIEVSPAVNKRAVSTEKPLPQDPPASNQYQNSNTGRRQSGAQARQPGLAPPSRPVREPTRAASDNTYMQPLVGGASIARPNTGGSLTSTASGKGLPTRGSYGQPVAPTVADTNAHGRMSQPKIGKNYVISSPLQQDDHDSDYGRPSVQGPSKFERLAGYNDPVEPKGHKRSNTVSGISQKLFGRNVSFFGGQKDPQAIQEKEKPKKSYPPVSMTTGGLGSANPRPSMESGRRSMSFGFGRKRSGSVAGSASSQEKQTRRFSLLPASFSLKAIGIGKDYGTPGNPPDDEYESERGDHNRGYPEPATRGGVDQAADGNASYERTLDSPIQQGRRVASTATPPQHQRYASQGRPYDVQMSGGNPQYPSRNYRAQEPATNESESSLNYRNPPKSAPNSAPQASSRYPPGFNDYDVEDMRQPPSRSGRGVLQKNNRRFADAYDEQPGYGPQQNSGSSGAARKVMDFFRRRGKAREGDDR